MGAYLHSSIFSNTSTTPQTTAQPAVTLISSLTSSQWSVPANALNESPSFPWNSRSQSEKTEAETFNRVDATPHRIEIPDNRSVSDKDIDVLVKHINSGNPLQANRTASSELFSLVCASAPQTLDFPVVHSQARNALETRFTSGPHDLLPEELWQDAELALTLARKYQIISIQPGLFYTFITTSHFEVDSFINQLTPNRFLTPADLEHCSALQNRLLELFAPTLFQAPPAGHMECTDALAAAWLADVVPAAFNSSGDKDSVGVLDLGRPFETLKTLEKLDWASKGVCNECIEGKKKEWKAEREAIWSKLSQWVEDSHSAKE